MTQASAQNPTAAARPATNVPAGVVISGAIEGVTDLHVHGRVMGKVEVGDLVVEDGGVIDGPVRAEAAVIRGWVIGPINARTVRLGATARIDGDISCASLEIQQGARLRGHCSSHDEPPGDVVQLWRASLPTPAAGEPPRLAPASSTPLSDAGQDMIRLAARLRRFSE